MFKKIISLFILLITVSFTSYSQISGELTIKNIRYKIDNLGQSLKSDAQIDKMYLSIDDEGKRWIYIEMQEIDGLKSDEHYLSREISEQIVKMIFKSINYDLEQTINLKTFANTLLAKSIKGVEFRTKNNFFHFNWTEILKSEQLSTTNEDDECQNIEIPPAPAFTKAEIYFPMEYLKDDFTCNFDLHYIGYILKATSKFICLKDEQSVTHHICFNKSDLSNASKSWLPYIMIPGNKVEINAVTCGNGGILQIKKIKNLRR